MPELRPGVFVAMPAYRGTDVIEESIRSVLAQTYQDFHLVISVDGAEDPTIEVCRKYAEDPRIDVVVQENRLGWPGNFNWLVRGCDREFFCYWQQDDLASTGYLENLRRELLARPDAAITYTDVQWFGASFDRTSTPAIEGDRLSRVMQHIEAIRYEPLRGLIRASMLPPGPDPIPVTEDESCQEEFVFLAHLAAAGAFVRVDSAMYFKRLHQENAFVRWSHFPEWRRRRGWISMGAGMIRAASDLAAPDARPLVTAHIADRLAVIRHGRGHFYAPPQTPDGIARFVRDFVSYAGLDAEDLKAPTTHPSSLQRPVHQAVVSALEEERQKASLRADLGTELMETGHLSLQAADPRAESILVYGWSGTEPWGVWTEGGEAWLHVPVPSGRYWTARLEGRAFGLSKPVRIVYGPKSGPLVEAVLTPDAPTVLVVELGPTTKGVRLRLPDASSPSALGLSADNRLLGFGLHSLDLALG